MRVVINKTKMWLASDRALHRFRQFLLHSSCAGFAADLTHAVFGEAMMFASVWEQIEKVDVRYSALAAALIVYIDGAKERVREKIEEIEHEVHELVTDAAHGIGIDVRETTEGDEAENAEAPVTA